MIMIDQSKHLDLQIATEVDKATFDAVLQRTELMRAMRRGEYDGDVGNFDPASIDDQFAKLAMETAEVRPIHDHAKLGPIKINAVYISLRPVELTDRQTGEIVGRTRSTIVDDKGVVWATNSPIAERVTSALCGGILGLKRFDPPLPIYAKVSSTANGGQCLVLNIDRDDIQRTAERLRCRAGAVSNSQDHVPVAERANDTDRQTQLDPALSGGGRTLE